MNLFDSVDGSSRNVLCSSKSPKPFLKWAGGKRSIIKTLLKKSPKTFNNYYEPFLGGGALFFSLNKKGKSFLSDLNLELIITYNQLCENPLEVINNLVIHKENHSKEYYYKTRGMFNINDPIQLASRFIYLNKTCFNGLFRVNKKEEFNVPIGNYKNPKIYDLENLIMVSDFLKGNQITYCDYLEINPQENDFVYFDPPYHRTDINSFTSYTRKDFTEKDHIQLSDFTKKLHKKGVKFMVSNSDTPFIRELYKEPYLTIENVSAPRNINCKSDERKSVSELLIRNYN